MNKVILVVLDGLNADVAIHAMGFMQALCEQKQGRFYTLSCELPSMSRPLYECILTGVEPAKSGIYNNRINHLSQQKSIFHYARESGLRTAAAAYYWVSELYNHTPFDAAQDRHVANEALPIQYGHFYYEDHYPDSHLFDDAEHLRRTYDPHFLLIHPMNIDDAGHRTGLDSHAYRNSARMADMYLSPYLAQWITAGYQVLITSDHGMNNDLSHGGTLPEERRVPLYVFGDAFSMADTAIKQTQLCGTVCSLLGVQHDKPACPGLLK
ncbi:alkaline phosphatase family protein [Snodgrassella sp. CFCC 13594]|uniref:alkaline phosphatase family protein n=1 Tax=Snodgrassella sp. CFCC 13594 TaxID=1775559 RepID=UPI00083699A0|nr:alkaline phosphatase family protein [Snodgrassella sp. CFCC 13594]